MYRYGSVTFVAFLLIGSLHAQDKKTIQPIDLISLNSVSDAQISPDGQKILFVLGTPATSGAKRSRHIWVVDANGATPERPLIYSGVSDSSPQWSPDGKSIAFLTVRPNPLANDKSSGFRFTVIGAAPNDALSKQESKGSSNPTAASGAQIWLFHPDGGEAEPLTDIAGGVKSFKWMPDGRSIAFTRRDQESPEEIKKRKDGEDWDIAQDYHHIFDRLWLYDLAQKSARLVTKQDFDVDAFAPSPDGSQFLLRISPTLSLNDLYYVNKAIIVDATTGEEKKVVNDDGGFSGEWAPNGKYVVIQKQVDKKIGRFPFIYNIETGAKTPITTEVPATLGAMKWEAGGNDLIAFAEENTHSVLERIDIHTGVAKDIKLIGAAGGGFTTSKDEKTLAFICSLPDHPGEVCVLSGDKPRILTENNPQVKNWSLGRSVEVHWKSSKDGTVIHGLLIYPANYQQGKKYKTIVHVHGGPIENFINGWNGSWYNPAQYFASHGYAVLEPMVRGSSGSGPAFENLNYRGMGTSDFPDLMDGVDYIVALGVADPDRLGLGGWSYGGYMTMWGVTHTDRFKAAVVGAGISDVFADALTTDIAPTYLNGYYGPFKTNYDRKMYDEDSPINFISAVKTPVLILQGEADVRVPTSQNLEFYNGLRFLGKDVMMVTYPREPHIFNEPKHQIDSLTRRLAWYDKHLQ